MLRSILCFFLVILLGVFISCNEDDFTNTNPTISDQSFSIDENSEAGTEVGTIVASDTDTDQKLKFSIVDGNTNNAFSLSENGVLSVNSSSALDFETNSSFQLTIEVEDDFEGTDQATIEILISDGNDAHVVDNQEFTIEENAQNAVLVGSIVVSDEDQSIGTYNYSISEGNTDNTFEINSSGEILVAGEIDYESISEYNLAISVSDEDFDIEASIDISVINQTITQSGLVAFYPFSGNANDESSNSNNGVVNGATLTDDRQGNTNSAYSFDGSDDYIDLGDAEVFELGDYEDFTLSVWVKSESESISGSETIFSKYISASDNRVYNFYLIATHDFQFAIWENGATSNSNSLKATLDNSWNNLTLVKDGNVVTLFIDGVQTEQLTLTFSMLTGSTANAVIGAAHFSNSLFDRNFNGTIDDFRLYNRALSQSEIDIIYAELD